MVVDVRRSSPFHAHQLQTGYSTPVEKDRNSRNSPKLVHFGWRKCERNFFRFCQHSIQCCWCCDQGNIEFFLLFRCRIRRVWPMIMSLKCVPVMTKSSYSWIWIRFICGKLACNDFIIIVLCQRMKIWTKYLFYIPYR